MFVFLFLLSALSSFDRLRMRMLAEMKGGAFPHPELVEGRGNALIDDPIVREFSSR
jgi:hypothetical protein